MKNKSNGRKRVIGVGAFFVLDGFLGLIANLFDRKNEDLFAISVVLIIIGGVIIFLGRVRGSGAGVGKTNSNNQLIINRINNKNNIGGSKKESDTQIRKPAAVRYCPRCGHANPSDALFCAQDGERLK